MRYLDAMHQLLRAVKAPAGEITELKKLYDAQRIAGVTGPTPVAPTPTAVPTLDLPPAATERAGTGKGLKPWIE